MKERELMSKWEELLQHQGHKIVVARYENEGEVHNISLECEGVANV